MGKKWGNVDGEGMKIFAVVNFLYSFEFGIM